MTEAHNPAKPVVYVRPVAATDLPQDMQAQTTAETLYAIHNPDGQRIAIVEDYQTAFRLARANHLAPMSVH